MSFNSGKKFRTPKQPAPSTKGGGREEALRQLKGKLTARSKRLKITLPRGGKDDRI